MLTTAIYIQWASIIFVASPFLVHWIIVRRWISKFSLNRPAKPKINPRLGLILPCWNEELLIAGKLDDIAKQDFPQDKMKILVIDSASTDNTVAETEKWLDNNNSLGREVTIIVEEERRGKASALIRAIGELVNDVDIIAMSDIDARLGEGALEKIVSWFEIPEIGAVCGRSVMLTNNGGSQIGQEVAYRGFHDMMRKGESVADSTPIFEGSIAAFRSNILEEPYLDEESISDDSELAVNIRNSGFRSIQDPEIIFFEAPSTNDSFVSQKVRRAQGLVRMFWKNISIWFRPKYGKWGYILGAQGVMHVILPWVFLVGILAGLLNATSLFLGKWSVGDWFLGDATIVFSSIIAGFYILGVFGFPSKIMRIIATFANYNAIILGAQVQLIRGRSMHKWSQVTSVRDAISAMEKDSDRVD